MASYSLIVSLKICCFLNNKSKMEYVDSRAPQISASPPDTTRATWIFSSPLEETLGLAAISYMAWNNSQDGAEWLFSRELLSLRIVLVMVHPSLPISHVRGKCRSRPMYPIPGQIGTGLTVRTLGSWIQVCPQVRCIVDTGQVSFFGRFRSALAFRSFDHYGKLEERIE